MTTLRAGLLERFVFLASVVILAALSQGAAAQEVHEFHGNSRRDGVYVVPNLTVERARHLRVMSNFDGHVQGSVYAQLLSFRSSKTNQPLLLVATEENVVYALDAESGHVVWMRSVGEPVYRSSLPCGNIDPVGITGTPAIDERRRSVYFDAMVGSGKDSTPQHLIFGLSLEDGAVLPGFPIDVASALRDLGIAFQPRFQNQRGALAIVGDTLFVPYGGNYGDCGPYHGVVVGVKLDGSRQISAWTTRGEGGGIWAPGGVASDGRSVFVVTGNTKLTMRWVDGEAVVRLPLGSQGKIASLDYFAPSNWKWLDLLDLDLGGTNPVLFDLQSGNEKVELVMALGKDGKAYLLSRERLGGIGGALLVTKIADSSIRTAPAVYAGTSQALVLFQAGRIRCSQKTSVSGLGALRVKASPSLELAMAWCAPLRGEGSPIVTTTDGHSEAIAWVVGAEGDNCLHGFLVETGEPVRGCAGEQSAMHDLRHFASVTPAFGRLYVAGDNRVYAFEPR